MLLKAVFALTKSRQNPIIVDYRSMVLADDGAYWTFQVMVMEGHEIAPGGYGDVIIQTLCDGVPLATNRAYEVREGPNCVGMLLTQEILDREGGHE